MIIADWAHEFVTVNQNVYTVKLYNTDTYQQIEDTLHWTFPNANIKVLGGQKYIIQGEDAGTITINFKEKVAHIVAIKGFMGWVRGY